MRYYKEARHAVCLGSGEDEVRPKRDNSGRATTSERRGSGAGSMRRMEVKYKTRGGGRCCMCFDPFSIQNVSVIVFFCCHAYHTTCLMDSMHSISSKSVSSHEHSYGEYDDDDDDEEEDDENRSGTPQMRCILCTTAAQ